MKDYIKNGIKVAAVCLAGAFLFSCSTVKEEPKFKARDEYYKTLFEQRGYKKETGQIIIEAKVDENFFKIIVKDMNNNDLLEMIDEKPYPNWFKYGLLKAQKDLPFDGIDKVRVYVDNIENQNHEKSKIENPRYEELKIDVNDSYFKALEKKFDDLAFEVVEKYKEHTGRLQDYKEYLRTVQDYERHNQYNKKNLKKHINSILEEIEKQQ